MSVAAKEQRPAASRRHRRLHHAAKPGSLKILKASYATKDGTAARRQGTNTLEVEVINTWHNRLVGDRQAGATPTSFTTTHSFNANSPLQPSGLLGPVRLVHDD